MFLGEGSYAFIMGIISGYPIGAKIINKFIEDGICTKTEAERMLAFTNNSGPLFIIGTVGISLFGDYNIGIILFITHILACITVGLLFGFMSKHNLYFNKRNRNYTSNNPYKTYTICDLGNILNTSITNSISTILLIGGFIILFSIIISILNSLNILEYGSHILSYIGLPECFGKSIIIGLFELTNGISAISSVHVKNMSMQIIISAFLLGIAGLSIFLQIFSIASKNNLSMKPYFIGKLLQGCFAAFYTFIILYFFNNFYFNL